MLLDDFVDETRRRGLKLSSVRVYVEGQLVGQMRFCPDKAVNQYSVTKMVTSAAVGIAVSEGLLTLSDRVCDVLYEHVPEGAPQGLSSLTLLHLLTMTTGHGTGYLMPGQTDKYKERDWIAYTLSRPMEFSPGERFVYDNSASYLLGAMLQKKTGQTLDKWLTPRLFAPLGITDFSWGKCPLGLTFAGSELRIKTPDMAKIGLLFATDGGNILDPAWVKTSTTKQVDTDWPGDGAYGYGYQLWMTHIDGVCCAEGMMGQVCVIAPKKGAVIAVNGADSTCKASCEPIFDYLWDTIYEKL